MTIPEYYEAMAQLEKAFPEGKEFLRNICIATSHEFFWDTNKFADVCIRCGLVESWLTKIQ